jgi:SAM-dependent methyltransferase
MGPMSGDPDPYERIAPFYDAEFASADADVSWFARRTSGGATLVLGCGTGRVARGLAAPGRVVIGLDRSGRMLELARRAAPGIRWVEGDMRSFDLGTVDAIIAPNAAFSFLRSRADQAACLSSCERALRSGGELWIDVPMPDLRWLGQPHTPEFAAWEGRVEGRIARRSREVRRFPVAQRLELTDRYRLDDELVATSLLVLRLIWPAEAEWMVEAAGMYVDAMYGDYAGNPLREGCPRLLLRAVKP